MTREVRGAPGAPGGAEGRFPWGAEGRFPWGA